MKKQIMMIVILLSVILSGCGMNGKMVESETESESETKIMNVPISEVSSIEVYSEGKVSTISADSEEVLSLLKILEDNENKVGMIDSCLGCYMAGADAENYADYSKLENCRVYMFQFSEHQKVTYADYESKENIIAVYIVPEKEIFGTVIDSSGNGNCAYAGFACLEENIFAQIED